MSDKEFPLTEYLTEEEQIEQLKRWVKEYGLTVIAGIAIAFVIVSGWHYWQDYRARILYHASSVYDEMLTLRAQNDNAAMVVQANKIMTHYKSTPYAQMAALMLARNDVDNTKYDDAITHLSWVVRHGKNVSIREIARVREARILIAQKKFQDALNLLDTVDDASFGGYIDEVRGDAFLGLNNVADAKQAYSMALKQLPHADAIRPVLQMKFDNLG